MNPMTLERTKNVFDFVFYLKDKKIPLTPEILAKKFQEFFHDSLPVYSVDNFCQSIGIKTIEYQSLPNNIHGFHCISPKDEITIIFDKKHTGTIHTLFHEIYEMLCELRGHSELKSEYKANLFAASIIMPEDDFFRYATQRKLLMNQVMDYRRDIAPTSYLLRINYLLKKHHKMHAAFLLRNKLAYKYKISVSEINSLSNFETILSTNLPINFESNMPPIKSIIKKAVNKIPLEDTSDFFQARIYIVDYIILAESIINYHNNAIKEIAIQILKWETYNDLQLLLKKQRTDSSFKNLLSNCINKIN